MRDDEKCRYVCVVIGWVLIAVLAVMCLGCKSVQYVPVETVRTDTCYVNKIRTDSVYVRDSVVVERGGDTIKVTAWRWRERYVVQRDTIYLSKTDSIAVPYPVERKLTLWKKMKQDIGGIAIGAFIVVVSAVVIWLNIKKMRK
jgi:hypothetical protein